MVKKNNQFKTKKSKKTYKIHIMKKPHPGKTRKGYKMNPDTGMYSV